MKATNETLWKTSGAKGSLALPMNKVRSRSRMDGEAEGSSELLEFIASLLRPLWEGSPLLSKALVHV
jgi:hypothetical protein